MFIYCVNNNLPVEIDDADFERVNAHQWWAYIKSVRSYFNGRHVSLASFILGDLDAMVDHKDRNFLNNKRENLRPANPSLNAVNRGKVLKADSTSKYKGVRLTKKTGKWVATICKDRKYTHIGTFHTAEAAAKAYNDFAKHLHGEYAVLNDLCQTTKI